ncbi:MAG: helix-hairpin-helix domain-containing protein [Desulfobacterales bacterium]|jgi:competence protein ComEA
MRKLKSWIGLISVLLLILIWLPALWAEETQKININTAPADELMILKGIGVKKAKAIIEFRENNGPFEQPEDLINVPGIGPKTFEANKNRIIVE